MTAAHAEAPPYSVPTMDEIAAVEPCGFDAVSTFSGCGGSSLGYRMAGFRVLWASEFVDAARDTYRANAAPHTVLDGRDIREVTGADILAATGKAVGELDVFDGSPPCASFSTAGARHKSWGQVKKYSDRAQRTDDLFYEYARLVDDVQPRVFVAENVSGLVKGSAKGYFKQILAALQGCGEGYQVGARVLDASWLGVPQARQRLFFVGVRRDLDLPPVYPTPLPYRYTVRDALPWITGQGDNGAFGTATIRAADVPSPTIGASPNTGNGRAPASFVCGAPDGNASRRTTDPETGQALPVAGRTAQVRRARRISEEPVRRITLGELRALCGFPPDFVLTGTYTQRWERLGRAVPPVMMSHLAAAVRDHVLTPARDQGRIG